LIVSVFPPEIGGPATQAFHLAQALRDRGYAVTVAAFDPARTFLEGGSDLRVYRFRLRAPGAASGVSRMRDYLAFFTGFVRLLRRETPSVVHCNSVGAYSLIVGIACRMKRIPCVVKFASDLAWEVVNRQSVTVDTIEEAYRYNLKARVAVVIERITLKLFTLIWATSDYRRKTLVRLLRVPKLKIRVIPNYILLPDSTSRKRSNRTNRISLITGGRLVPHKRFEDCLLALDRLRDLDLVLRLYGEGTQESTLLQLVRKLHLEDRVLLLGRLPYGQLTEALLMSDVYVSASIEEGFPVSIVEAMAAGLPIVAARKGAIPELVPEGEAGFLFEPRDVEDLARALRILAEDAALRERLGANASKRAQRLDLRSGVTEYSDMFHEAINLVQARKTSGQST